MPLVHAFVLLQLLDFLTTLVGLKWGAHEVNPFIRHLMQARPLVGLLGCKMMMLLMAGVVIRYKRPRVLLFVNYIFAFLVIWNLVQILRIPLGPESLSTK